MLRTVAAVVMERSAVFELGVACEVFGIDRTAQGVPRFDFRVRAEHPGRPLGSTGVGILAPHGLDAIAVAGTDAVIVPAVAGPPPR